MNRFIKIAAFTGIAFFATATAASASVNVTDGVGFVGKGDVQTVMGWNNKQLQDAVDGKGGLSVKFTVSQAAEQAFSQSASQTSSQSGTQSASQTGTKTGSQTATQEVTQTLSCEKNGAPIQKSRHGVRSDTRTDTVTDTVTDTRSATRDGVRDGFRAGSRAGVVNGSVVSDVAADARKTGQWTGFNLKGMGTPTFTASGAVVWNDPAQFGEWSFDDEWSFASDFQFDPYKFGEYEFEDFDLGSIEWGAWDTDGTNADPDVCVNNGNGITNFSDKITEGPVVVSDVTETEVTETEVVEDQVVPGTTQYDEVEYGTPAPGAVTATGPSALFVNGKALPNTPAVVPAA